MTQEPAPNAAERAVGAVAATLLVAGTAALGTGAALVVLVAAELAGRGSAAVPAAVVAGLAGVWSGDRLARRQAGISPLRRVLGLARRGR